MIDEKLAMLNPATCRFDLGRGGIPALTPQDLAAAIGMTPDGLGRELLIASGWPDASDTRRIVGLACALAEVEMRRQVEERTREGMRYALDRWHDGHRARPMQAIPGWPRTACERMPAIAVACAAEATQRALCPDCDGRGHRMLDALSVPCTTCRASGIVPVSDRARARMIGIDESTYRRDGWALVYGWMLRTMMDALLDARRSLRRATA